MTVHYLASAHQRTTAETGIKQEIINLHRPIRSPGAMILGDAERPEHAAQGWRLPMRLRSILPSVLVYIKRENRVSLGVNDAVKRLLRFVFRCLWAGMPRGQSHVYPIFSTIDFRRIILCYDSNGCLVFFAPFSARECLFYN